MVAAAKFRKAQQRMFEMRPYADRMNTILSSLASSAEGEIHPLLAVRPRKNIEVLVMTSDRGLCGAFNTNILKAATRHVNELKKEGYEVGISIVGRKARDYYKRRRDRDAKAWTGISGKISYANAQEIAADIIENYTNETIDEVVLIYNEFKSAIAQQVVVQRLLPLEPIKASEEDTSRYTISSMSPRNRRYSAGSFRRTSRSRSSGRSSNRRRPKRRRGWLRWKMRQGRPTT